MSESFDISVWRTYYDDISAIGRLLKEPIDDNGHLIPWDERERMRKDADNLCKQCANYMNAHKIKLPRPLWYYSYKDPTTWLSHETFAFYHLILK